MQLGKTTLKEIDDLMQIQLQSSDDDHYMRGMYNGMEFVRSCLAGTEPVYANPNNELDPEAYDRNLERFI